MIRRLFGIQVVVDFPALASFAGSLNSLVEYLKTQDQAEVDALQARIETLTARLKQSAGALKAVVDAAVQQ